MVRANDLLERFERLNDAQRQKILELIEGMELQAREEANQVTDSPVGEVHQPTESTTPRYPYEHRIGRGPGPWCQTCGATMGMHGGEYICTSCYPC